MNVWVGEHEVSAAQFAVAARGVAPERIAGVAQVEQLLARAADVGGAQAVVREAAAGGVVASILTDAAHLLLRAHPATGEALLTVHTLGDPAAAVRWVEPVVLELLPKEVSLCGLPAGGASSWTPYPPFGALFVRGLHREVSAFQEIEVGEHPVYGRMLFLNGETQIASSDEARYSQALVEPALRGGAGRVLILGGGDCGVLREVLRHEVAEVVMVEIDPAVVEVSARYFPETVGGGREDPRARIVFADAAAFLHAQAAGEAFTPAEGAPIPPEPFDVVIYDLSDDPLGLDSVDELCGQITRVLAPGGRVGVQCGSGLPLNRDKLARSLKGLERNFREVTTRELLIPSFLEQPWVFAFARRQG